MNVHQQPASNGVSQMRNEMLAQPDAQVVNGTPQVNNFNMA